MPKWAYVDQGVQGLNIYQAGKMQGNQQMMQQGLDLVAKSADALRGITGVQQARQQMDLARAAEARTQQLFPLQMEAQRQVTQRGQIELGREQKLEQAYQTIAQERGEPVEVIKARAEALETEARVPAAQEQIQRYAVRRQVGAVPAEVAAEVSRASAGVAEANLAAKSAQELMVQDYPRISAAAKTAMAELEPVQVARQIDATTQRILTEMLTRDPTVAQIKANIAFTQAKTQQLGEPQAQDWRALLNMYQYLAKLKADDYALKTYGRTTAELEVDRLQQRGQMTKDDAIRLYIQLLRMTDPMADPMTAMMWQQFGIDRSSQQDQMKRRAQLMERLKQYIEKGGAFTMEPTATERAETFDQGLRSAWSEEGTPPAVTPPSTPEGQGASDVDTMLDAIYGPRQ